MFWMVAKKLTIEDIVDQSNKKLEGDELVESVKKLQDSATSRTDKNKIFKDLLFTFKGLIINKFKSVNHVATNQSEREDIIHHIASSFYQVLTELTPKSAKEIVSYIAHAFNTKINQESIRLLLGKGEAISDVGKYKFRFKNALRDFVKKYKRMPDFNKIDLNDLEDESDLTKKQKSDLELFSEILGTSEDQTLEILKLFGSDTIKSMSESVSKEEDEGDMSLGDLLKSDDPLPDEVLQNKELRKSLEKEIDKLISDPGQRKVIRTYFFPTDEEIQKAIKMFGDDKVNSKKLTNDQVAGITGYSERQVRHWLSKDFRDKLEKSLLLKEHASSTDFVTSFIQSIKASIVERKTEEDLILEVLANRCGR